MQLPALALVDLDGTLVDSLPDIARCVDQMLVRLGLAPVGLERVRGWVGNGVEALVAREEDLAHPSLADAPQEPIRTEGSCAEVLAAAEQTKALQVREARAQTISQRVLVEVRGQQRVRVVPRLG